MTNKKTALPVCTPRSECNHRIRATVFPFVSGSKIGAKNVFGSVGFFHKQKGRGRGEKEKRENAALSNASTINLVSTANAITRPSPRTSIVNVAPHVPPPSSPPLFPSPIEKRLTNKPLEKRVVPLFAATSFVIIRRGELGGGVCIVARLLVGNVIFPLLFILARRREDPFSLSFSVS